MSYRLDVPNVRKDVEFEELHDRVNESLDAVGLTEANAAPGVRERALASVDAAMGLIDKLSLEGDTFHLSLHGHVSQHDTDADSASVGITRAFEVLS